MLPLGPMPALPARGTSPDSVSRQRPKRNEEALSSVNLAYTSCASIGVGRFRPDFPTVWLGSATVGRDDDGAFDFGIEDC